MIKVVSTWVVLSACCSWCLCAQTPKQELVNALALFEHRFEGVAFSYTLKKTYREGPAWPSNTVINDAAGICWNDGRSWQIEQHSNIAQPMHCLTYPVPDDVDLSELPVRESEKSGIILTPDSTVRVLIRDPASGSIHLGGTLKSNEGSVNHLGRVPLDELGFLFGFEKYLAYSLTPFSFIAGSSRVQCTASTFDGTDCEHYLFDTDWGSCSVYLKRSDGELLPLQIELVRSRGDLLSESDDRLRVQQSFGMYLFGNEPAVVEMTHTYRDLRYEVVNGKSYCCAYTLIQREEYADGREAVCIDEVAVTEIKTRAPEIKSHSLEFATFQVPEKTRFHAEDSPQIPYIVYDGKITKVVNEKVLESLDGARFKPAGKRRWILPMLIVAFALVAGLLAIRKYITRE